MNTFGPPHSLVLPHQEQRGTFASVLLRFMGSLLSCMRVQRPEVALLPRVRGPPEAPVSRQPEPLPRACRYVGTSGIDRG